MIGTHLSKWSNLTSILDMTIEDYQSSKISENTFSTPKYLFKAAMLGAENGKIKEAISFLDRIEKEYPKAEEAKWVAVQKGRLEHMKP